MKRIILTAALFFGVAIQAVQAQNDKKSEFNKTLDAYYTIKNALATDNLNQSNAGAAKMRSSLQAFPVQGLDETQKAAWNAQSAVMKKVTAQMEAEKDIKAQRKNFETLSYAMIKIVKAVKLSNKTVYVEYCPMAKASWLNETEEIQNPYYGSIMYDCGNVKETFAAPGS